MKKHRLFLLVLLILGTFSGSFHHHEDGHINENCSVCIIQNLLVDSDLPDIPVPLELFVLVILPFVRPVVLVCKACLSHYPSRAPPIIS